MEPIPTFRERLRDSFDNVTSVCLHLLYTYIVRCSDMAEAESKEKLCVWDPMPELTITSPYVHARVDSNTVTMGNPEERLY